MGTGNTPLESWMIGDYVRSYSDEPTKQNTARNLLDRLANEATIVVSTQVLQEFYVSVMRKLAQPDQSRSSEAFRPTPTRVNSFEVKEPSFFFSFARSRVVTW